MAISASYNGGGGGGVLGDRGGVGGARKKPRAAISVLCWDWTLTRSNVRQLGVP